nr:peptidylprolyl isomerase [Erysipelothrix anatis]
MKKLSVLMILGILLVGCSSKPKEEPVSPPETKTETESKTDYSKETNPVATITMTNGDVITAELYPEVAPNTVNNFITLANSGFYDGVIFHRVIPGFMIQGGDPDGTGMGGPGYGIKGEFANNGFPNDLKHNRGVLSMARAQDPNSAGSQFFITHKDSPHLDKDYAAFGMVTSGLDVVDKIAALDRDRNDRPTTDSDNVIASITVDTKGVTYPSPEKN